ncbi:MAG: hypothetical protein M1833_003130 [Piccolia ochrophora]|nr:MAG: hypothetical protein M1833_003130 [Piccolia ochrophora]
MAVSKKRSLAEMQNYPHSSQPRECDLQLYEAHALRLHSSTEQALDERLDCEAQELGLEEPPSAESSQIDDGDPSHDSTSTIRSTDRRSGSSSEASRSTGITSPSLDEQLRAGTNVFPVPKRSLQRSISFSEYEKFLEHSMVEQSLSPALPTPPPIPSHVVATPSIFSASSRRSYASIRRGIRRWSTFNRGRSTTSEAKSCVSCRGNLKKSDATYTLLCAHDYCTTCLHSVVEQAMDNLGNMPPTCCGTAVPGSTIKAVLTPEEQQTFLERGLEYAISRGDRVLCPNPYCGELVQKEQNLDPQRPFEMACQYCKGKICKHCTEEAHQGDRECPIDWELEALRQLGDHQIWRRCHSCAALVELGIGCIHMSCTCGAMFCYMCGAVWDAVAGCPNSCNYDEDIIRRREADEEGRERNEREAREREVAEAERALKALEATSRSAENEDIQTLRDRHAEEQEQFIAFEQKQKWTMWARQGQAKLALSEHHTVLERNLTAKHEKTASTLEDRQVSAEMDLRQTLKQERKACAVRLRHMEAYCEVIKTQKLGQPAMSSRVVTDRDLRELHQQYRLRDTMDRSHESRINVMRDRQTKQLETLESRQADEMEKLRASSATELDALQSASALENTCFNQIFASRRARVIARWFREEAILRKRLELESGLAYGSLSPLLWPDAADEGSKAALSTTAAQSVMGASRPARRPSIARACTAPVRQHLVDSFILPASSAAHHGYQHLERSFLIV